jgi:hypothetical protein
MVLESGAYGCRGSCCDRPAYVAQHLKYPTCGREVVIVVRGL